MQALKSVCCLTRPTKRGFAIDAYELHAGAGARLTRHARVAHVATFGRDATVCQYRRGDPRRQVDTEGDLTVEPCMIVGGDEFDNGLGTDVHVVRLAVDPVHKPGFMSECRRGD